MSGFIIATEYGNKSVPNYFFALGKELARRGHPVLLLVDARREDAEIRSGNPRVLTWPSFRPTALRDASFLHRHIREMRPTVVVANFGAVNVSVLTSFLARVPVRVAWYHTLSRQLDLDHPDTWKRRAQAWRKKQVYRFATSLVAVSEAARADLERAFGVPAEKTLALPLLLPDPPPLAAGPSAGRKRIVCVGRLDASKGQATLIRAFAEVRAAVPEASLELLGEGPARPAYEALADSLGVRAACDFPGFRPFEEAMQRLAAAHVAVVSSRAEALGLAAVEALSVGVPIVASRVDGLTEIVVDGQTGYLVEPGDSKGLAERIVALLTDESTRRRLSENARRRFRDVFSTAGIGRHADALEALTRS